MPSFLKPNRSTTSAVAGSETPFLGGRLKPTRDDGRDSALPLFAPEERNAVEQQRAHVVDADLVRFLAFDFAVGRQLDPDQPREHALGPAVGQRDRGLAVLGGRDGDRELAGRHPTA